LTTNVARSSDQDDVDLLALHFLHHRLHAAALHADAGPTGSMLPRADHADLGARTRDRGRRP
jgi:hypothetical protein